MVCTSVPVWAYISAHTMSESFTVIFVHRDFYSRVCNVTLPTVIQPFHGCNGYYNNEFSSNKKLK